MKFSISTLTLFVCLWAGPLRADNILDFQFLGVTNDERGYDITNLNGHSLEGKSFSFRFGVDQSKLKDIDSKSNKARFVEGLTKGFFRVGDDLYQGEGDLTDYEISIVNDQGGKDKFKIKFNNFFGEQVNKNHKAKDPKDFSIILEDRTGDAFCDDPTAENFPKSFDISDWAKAQFEIEWKSGTKLRGSFHELNAVPEPSHFVIVLVLAVGGYFYIQRNKTKAKSVPTS